MHHYKRPNQSFYIRQQTSTAKALKHHVDIHEYGHINTQTHTNTHTHAYTNAYEHTYTHANNLVGQRIYSRNG